MKTNIQTIAFVIVASVGAVIGAYVGKTSAEDAHAAAEAATANERASELVRIEALRSGDLRRLVDDRLYAERKVRRLFKRDPDNPAILLALADIKRFDRIVTREGWMATLDNEAAVQLLQRAYDRARIAHIQLCSEGVPYPPDELNDLQNEANKAIREAN